MPVHGNVFQNNALAGLMSKAPQNVVHAIQNASAKTGVDFAYLLENAAAESSFDPKAKARTSSATGLFQFIEKTWIDMVKNHGHKYGLGNLAEKIDDSGRVADRAARRNILELRKDPEMSAFMAAELAANNKTFLEQNVGGDIGATELYFAHFMGASGGTAFLREMKHNPMAVGADIFPREALANRGVFFNQDNGQPRTLQEIYSFFDRKFSDGPAAPMMAAAPADIPAQTMAATMPRPFDGPITIEPMRTAKSLAAMIAPEPPHKTYNFNRKEKDEPEAERVAVNNQAVFPSNLYTRLSVSPADLLSLSRYNS